MLRRIGYRAAATAFVFTGLWFVLGLLLLTTPLPGALGIAAQLFTVWLLFFFAILAAAGATLLVAAINGIFPLHSRAPSRADAYWAAPRTRFSAPRRPAAAGAAPRASRPPHRG